MVEKAAKRRRPPSARDVAVRVLMRVEKDTAYAAAALDAELSRAAQLDSRDRGLCTEIVYGVLRTRGALEAELSKFVPAGLSRTDPWVRLHLVVAAYQIRLLDRVPAHAAVDAAVSEVRGQRGPKVAGFVNAVLRKVGALAKPLSLSEAVEASTPEWLLARLRETVGPEEARALLGADAAAFAACVRLVSGKPLPDWLDASATGRVSARARLLQGGGDLRAKSGYAEGAFVIQEEGAQVVGLCLGARAGERVLDACAGRGQKSSLLAEQIAPDGELWAADLHPHKLRALGEEFERLGLLPPSTAAVDWTQGCGEVPQDYFDRVLVDAPCSGTGTLRRRPEIGRRLRPEDPRRLSELAEQILRRAACCARPGGRVVFAVCSVLPEEGEELALRVSDVLAPAAFDSEEAQAISASGAHELRLLPLAHGTEGYYVASFIRR